MVGHGLPIYVALEPVDMRMGYERLGGLVRERMQSEPRSKALFVFLRKRGHTMKVLTWDGTGAIIVHKKLDARKFELPKAHARRRSQLLASRRGPPRLTAPFVRNAHHAGLSRKIGATNTARGSADGCSTNPVCALDALAAHRQDDPSAYAAHLRSQ